MVSDKLHQFSPKKIINDLVKPEIEFAFNKRVEKKEKRYIDKIKSKMNIKYTDISGRNNNMIDEHSWERIAGVQKPILDENLRTIEISTDGPSLFQELKVL